MERHVRKSEKIVGGGKRGGEGGKECAVRREREREREAEIGQGGAAERKGKSGQRVGGGGESSRGGGRGGEGVKGWKNVGILQQSGWCEGGREKCCRKCWNQQCV